MLVVSGISKTYAMTGWRVGFAGGPKALIRAMCVMQGHLTSGVNVIAQAAAAAALDGPQEYLAERAALYRERRDIVVAALNAAGLRCHTPQGAFYAYPSVAGFLGRSSPGGRRIETDADFALALLEEAGVATVAGGAFGMSPFVRISTATDTALLRTGLRTHRRFLRRRALILGRGHRPCPHAGPFQRAPLLPTGRQQRSGRARGRPAMCRGAAAWPPRAPLLPAVSAALPRG